MVTMNKIFSILFFIISLFWSIYLNFIFYPDLLPTKSGKGFDYGNVHNIIIGSFWILSAFSTNKKAFVFFVPILFLLSMFFNVLFRFSTNNLYFDMTLNCFIYFLIVLTIYHSYNSIIKFKK